MKLSNPIRLGIQAFIAIILASIVSVDIAHDERGYWAVITAMLLISQTWGESVKRSLHRISMTIVGAIVGTLLYHCFQGNAPLLLFLLLTSVFFTVYFLDTSYPTAIFFGTLFIVFLFASLLGWSNRLMWLRIYETFIGAGIAVFTSALVFPISAKSNFKTALPDYLHALKQTTLSLINNIENNQCDSSELQAIHEKLLLAHVAVNNSYQSMTFENLFLRFPKKRLNNIMLQLWALHHFSTNLITFVSKSKNSNDFDAIKPELHHLKNLFEHNFTSVEQALATRGKGEELKRITSLYRIINKPRSGNPADKLDDTEFGFTPFIYMLKKLNETLFDLKNILS
jgi:uncharacterized membrane protein YccC